MKDIDVVGQLQDAFMREPVGDTLMAVGNALQEVQALQQQNAALEKQNAELLAALMIAHNEIATADLQIGDGHIQNARKTLDSVFEMIYSTVHALQPSTQEVRNER